MFGLLWFYTTAGWLWWGSAQHSRTVVLFEILILRVKNVKWDWEKTPFRQYVLVNSQESYIFVSAVCQCIFNVCLGCSWFFLSTHRWQEALTVYPRTNKQNQKKKRKVDPPTQQVTIGSPILNNDFFFFFFLNFKYPDRNWRIKITWLRSTCSSLCQMMQVFWIEKYHN